MTQTRKCVMQRKKGEVEDEGDKIIRHWVRKLVYHLQGGDEDYEMSGWSTPGAAGEHYAV